MHYSCLQGAGFEVSVCIMKAERIMIVMLYRSLVLSLPLYFSISLSCSLVLSRCVFLSVTLSFSQSVWIYSLFSSSHFRPLRHPCSLARSYTQTPSHLVLLVYYVRVSICRAWWLIETGAVKRPHTHSWNRRLTTYQPWFDWLVPELASPWRGSALGFPVNEVLFGVEG